MKFTGADITHLRQSARVSKVRLSRALGVNRRTIANWENEIGAPNVNQFFMLCRVFRVDIVGYMTRLEARRFITEPIDLEGL